MSIGISALAKIDETSKIEVKSTIEQIRNAHKRITEIQDELQEIYSELNKKVNLVSQALDNITVSTTVGRGSVTVSANAPNKVIGSNSLFTKYLAVNNQIQIGSEITEVASIIDDNTITVNPPFMGAYTNSLYAIIKEATKEQLLGDFEFGQINGVPFRGVINQDSSLEQYGRIALPNDVINLATAQKLVQPAMVLAQNAIRRTGDTIGDKNAGQNDTSERLRYIYGGTDFDFVNSNHKYSKATIYVDESSVIQWAGKPDKPADLVNVKYFTEMMLETRPIYITIRRSLKTVEALGKAISFQGTMVLDAGGTGFDCFNAYEQDIITDTDMGRFKAKYLDYKPDKSGLYAARRLLAQISVNTITKEEHPGKNAGGGYLGQLQSDTSVLGTCHGGFSVGKQHKYGGTIASDIHYTGILDKGSVLKLLYKHWGTTGGDEVMIQIAMLLYSMPVTENEE